MRALLSIFALAAALSAAPAAAQFQDRDYRQPIYESPYNPQNQAGLPQGSYRNSCMSISISGTGNNARLTATCRDLSGRQRVSTIAYRNCIGDIGNSNGTLVCAGATASPGGPQPQPAPNRLPEGSWTQSCIRGQIDGMRFTAQCLDQAGRRVFAEAAARNCRSYSYSNVNGRLVCDDDIYDHPGQGRGGGRGNDPYYGQLPLGPWRNSCRDASMRDGYVLTARCTNNRGQMQSTSIDIRACRRPSVVNENGLLKCE